MATVFFVIVTAGVVIPFMYLNNSCPCCLFVEEEQSEQLPLEEIGCNMNSDLEYVIVKEKRKQLPLLVEEIGSNMNSDLEYDIVEEKQDQLPLEEFRSNMNSDREYFMI
jgi:hypothetical protein